MALETSLKAELLEALTAYLQGRRPGKHVADWATAVRTGSDESSLDELSRWSLSALMCLGHDDPQWDTPVEDLEFYRDCLSGTQQFHLGAMPPKHR